jgi:hypothetical protein
MNDSDPEVFVEIAHIGSDTEIGWNAALVEGLTDRLDDLRAAMDTGTSAVAATLPDLPRAPGWALDEVSASFGIALVAEAGALVMRASANATFEVTVTYRPRGEAGA